MAARSSVTTLHARLNLPKSFAHSTLERCLIDHTASKESNNAGLAQHGSALLGYYVSDFLLTRYPRLPYKVTKNALISYAGWQTLAKVGREWGVSGTPREGIKVASRFQKPTETGRAPTGEELASLLQVSRVAPGHIKSAESEETTYIDMAYADFVRSVIGGLQIHGDARQVREFIDHHILSREVNLSKSFKLLQPQRELTFLCAREGLERPVTRLIAESGRRSNSPVFVIGVYSGKEKLGEGQASSLKEAEYLAQSNAMKAWYLFEDRSATISSTLLEGESKSAYKAPLIDVGDVIV